VNELFKRVRRWLRSRQGRLVLVGAVAGVMVSSGALAQEPSVTVVAPTPVPVSSTEHVQGVPFPAAHPPAEQAGGAAHGATHGETAPHGAEGHGAPAVHHPEAFNFADTARFQAEKEKAARGEKDAHGRPIVPVTPYAYLLINAGILYFIYYRFGKKPIGDGLRERHDSIAKELAEAARIRAEAEERAAEYKQKLERLGDELQQIKADIIKAGEADRARIVKEAEEKAERMKKDAQFLLDQELKQLRNDMIAFTAEAAVAAAESVLRSKVTSSDHDRLADEFLSDVAHVASAKSHSGGAA